jgi:uncharacterized alpha-E superfamily protein
MLARVADSAYWMSRYLERAEHSARLADVCLRLTLDGSSETVRRLLATVAAPPDGDAGVPEVRESIAACIAAARENARQIREQISTEMWEQLNGLYLLVSQRDQPPVPSTAQLADFYRFVKQSSHLFQGVTDSTMTQDQGWNFIQIGRYLERAATTAGMLEVHFGEASPEQSSDLGTYIEWAGLLRSCSAFEAYCRCYTADVRPERVAEFLLLNAQFPRSVHFAVDRVEASLREVGRTVGKSPARVDRLAGRLRALLDFSQIDEIMAADLRSYVREVKDQCERVHVALYQAYIAYPLELAIM